MRIKFVIVPTNREYVLGLVGFNRVLQSLGGHVIPLIQIQDIGYGEPTHTYYQVVKHINKYFYGQK